MRLFFPTGTVLNQTQFLHLYVDSVNTYVRGSLLYLIEFGSDLGVLFTFNIA